jgi:hypothetical protein
MFKYTPRHILFPEPEPTEILKAYRLKHGPKSGRDGDAWSEWYPEEAIRTHESDHPWYHQFEGDVPAHHPPFGFDHDSKELLWQNDYDSKNPHTDGKLAERPHTFHPMDYIIYDLAKYARKILGFSQDKSEEIVKQMVMTPAIDTFNAKHADVHGEDATHLLPGVNSVEWRRNTVGTFDKDSGGAMRMTRGSGTSDDGVQNPLINYSLNKGNVLSEHSDQGNFIDSGVNHLHEEMLEFAENYFERILEMVENPAFNVDVNDPEIREAGQRMTQFLADSQSGTEETYLNNPVVNLEYLTFHKVQHDRGRHERFEAGHERPIIDFHPLQGLEFAPPGMFDTVKTKTGNITPQFVKERFAEHGIEVTDEEAHDLHRMPKTHLVFGETRHNKEGKGSQPTRVFSGIANDLGIDKQSNEYQHIFHSINAQQNHGHSRHLLAIPRYIAQQLVAEGYPPEEVEEMVKQRFASHDYTHKNHTRSDELQKLGQDKFGQLKEKMGIPDLPENALTFKPLGDKQMRRGYTTVVPRYAEPHIHDDTAHPNMTVAQARAGQQAEMPVHTPEPMAEAPLPTNNLPVVPEGQTRLTDFQKAQVAEITEAMEHIQLEDAKQDVTILKMLPHNPIQLNSIQSVGLFAKDLGITSMDVHGLLHSRGDWHRIAKEWNVSPQVVKVVKVTFNGGV